MRADRTHWLCCDCSLMIFIDLMYYNRMCCIGGNFPVAASICSAAQFLLWLKSCYCSNFGQFFQILGNVFASIQTNTFDQKKLNKKWNVGLTVSLRKTGIYFLISVAANTHTHSTLFISFHSFLSDELLPLIFCHSFRLYVTKSETIDGKFR